MRSFSKFPWGPLSLYEILWRQSTNELSHATISSSSVNFKRKHKKTQYLDAPRIGSSRTSHRYLPSVEYKNETPVADLYLYDRLLGLIYKCVIAHLVTCWYSTKLIGRLSDTVKAHISFKLYNALAVDWMLLRRLVFGRRGDLALVFVVLLYSWFVPC